MCTALFLSLSVLELEFPVTECVYTLNSVENVMVIENALSHLVEKHIATAWADYVSSVIVTLLFVTRRNECIQEANLI